MVHRTAAATALALACAAAPAFAADPERAPEPSDQTRQPVRAAVLLPAGLGTLPIGRALDSLGHLRLRPAQNGDVSETAHRPAARGAE